MTEQQKMVCRPEQVQKISSHISKVLGDYVLESSDNINVEEVCTAISLALGHYFAYMAAQNLTQLTVEGLLNLSCAVMKQGSTLTDETPEEKDPTS